MVKNVYVRHIVYVQNCKCKDPLHSVVVRCVQNCTCVYSSHAIFAWCVQKCACICIFVWCVQKCACICMFVWCVEDGTLDLVIGRAGPLLHVGLGEETENDGTDKEDAGCDVKHCLPLLPSLLGRKQMQETSQANQNR